MSALAKQGRHAEEGELSGAGVQLPGADVEAPSVVERAFGLAIVAASVILLVVNVVWLGAIGYLVVRGDVGLGLVAMMAPIPLILIGTCFATGRCGRGLLH